MMRNWYVSSFLWQCVFFAMLSALVSYAYDKESALSLLSGGLAYCLPSLLTNLYIYKSTRMDNVLVKAYIGSVYRLLMAAGCLVLIFRETEFNPKAVIIGFCIGAVVQYVTSFLFTNREK